MLLILPPRGKLIIQHQVSERIAYAPLFGIRPVRLRFSFCLRPGSLLSLIYLLYLARIADFCYSSSCVRPDTLCLYIWPGSLAYASVSGLWAVNVRCHVLLPRICTGIYRYVPASIVCYFILFYFVFYYIILSNLVLCYIIIFVVS